MIASIEHRGVLIHECTLAGETRADDVYPAHCNAIQVSSDRWLVLYATRGFDGVDDDRSIIYQIRANTIDGKLLRENFLARTVNDWQPHADGDTYRKEHGHPVAFGVPRGALVNGALASSQNVFVVKWRVLGKRTENGRVFFDSDCVQKTQGVEWIQFRLNEAGDDIEILQAPQLLRQKGFESSERFCAHDVAWMNQTFINAIALDDEYSRWGDVNHFVPRETSVAQHSEAHTAKISQIAALEYSFNDARGVYEWTRIGPLLGDAHDALFEASLVRDEAGFIIAARRHDSNGASYFRATDLFAVPGKLVTPGIPKSYAPIGYYQCADGVTRLVTGDPQTSPYNNGRNPLYCWEITDDFSARNSQVLFDAKAAGLPFRPEAGTVVDMAKIVAHAGGRSQFFVHRVRPKAINFPANAKAVVNEEEKNCAAIYYGVLHYDQEYSAAWQF